MACKAAVKGNHAMSPQEADKLIDELTDSGKSVSLSAWKPDNHCHDQRQNWKRSSNESCKILNIHGVKYMKRPLDRSYRTDSSWQNKVFLLSLAKAVNGEIISADSMQVYKAIWISVLRRSRPEEMQGVTALSGGCSGTGTEEFHIVKFQQMAKEAMEEIYEKGKIPILVGGTGFYIQAVTRDIDFTRGAAG